MFNLKNVFKKFNNSEKERESKKGFTLIELLVVCSIIGFIVTLAIVSLNNAKKKERDIRRLANIKQIQTALELFYDHYSYYPSSNDSGADAGWDDSDIGDGFIIGLIGSNVRGDNPDGISFMSNVPGDPLDPDGVDSVCSQSYAYERQDGDQGYRIVVTPEQNSLQDLSDCGKCASYDICFDDPN